MLARLKSHPLAHASGWNIDERQDSDKGWTEKATPTVSGPRLGGAKWEKENDKLERELQRMSDSVNVMFKDQGDKTAYRRDEDRLFKQAVSALKTADQLYPDSPADQANDQALINGALATANGGGGGGGGRSAAEARILRGESPAEREAARREWKRKHSMMDQAVSLYKAGGDAALERAVTSGGSLRPADTSAWRRGGGPPGLMSGNLGPTALEAGLILVGCTMLAAAGWLGFVFCRRKSYYDLTGGPAAGRRRGRSNLDEEDGVELP